MVIAAAAEDQVTVQPMGNLDNQQAWVPYETTKDCSQGFCSVYCPQWCYIIFPPPPPFTLDDDSASASGTAFSPLVIAIIGVLASAFLLVSYYTIISKYCGRFRRRQRVHRRPNDNPDADSDDEEEIGDQSRRHETVWHVSTSNGLDEALISKIAVYNYKNGEGVVDGTDCSVCLGEFREDESLRLLPKCSHAFHVYCIDTWLKSHSNCPLCRANIVSTGAPPQLPAPPPPEPATHNEELVIVIDDIEISREEEQEESSTTEHKDSPNAPETSYDITEIGDSCADRPNEIGDSCGDRQIRRSFSDSSRHGRVSIADVLRMSMEDELLAAKDQGLWDGAGSSRRSGGEHGKGSGRSRGLHCVMSPVPMKRSFSSGRFCFNSRQGRGRNAVLPL